MSRSPHLRDAHLFIRPIDLTQGLADFANGGVSADAIDNERHRVGVADAAIRTHDRLLGSGILQRVKGTADFVIVAAGTQSFEFCRLVAGNGFVNVFDTSGNLIHRLISNGNLNSPWGLAIVEGELWVGNFGDGKINNYDPTTGAFLQTLMKSDGTPLQINGLWALLPLGDGVYFTAGIDDEAHGLFGKITED